MFRFGFRDYLFVYALIPLLVGFLWYAMRAKHQAMQRFGDLALMKKLGRTVSRRALKLKVALLLGTVFLLVTALARPQFGSRVEVVKRKGQNIMIAMDVSASMLAEDVSPSRLERAKLVVRSLIDRLEGDRVGLVAFAGTAFVQSPLTLDYAAARLFLNAMRPDLIPVPGTNLGEALDRSLEALAVENAQHRVLIVVTDGEDHSEDVQERVNAAVEQGVTIYTVGMGSSEGVPIPDIDSLGRRRGFIRDDDGAVVLTRLDDVILRDMARETGGAFYQATAGRNELDRLVDELAAREKEDLAAQEVTQFEEQYQIFLGMALVLLTVELLVPERRRSRSEWRGRFQ